MIIYNIIDKYQVMMRALLTMLWNGMDMEGGRGHIVVFENNELNFYELVDDPFIRMIYESFQQGNNRYPTHAEKLVPEFWNGKPVTAFMDKSPCTKCTDFLIKQYKNKVMKPTLYVSRLHTSEWLSKKDSIKNLKRLREAGFKVHAMTPEILENLFPEYKDDIEKVTNTKEFKKGQKNLNDNLKEAGFTA